MSNTPNKPIADEFIDEGLQGIGVRFTDETTRTKASPARFSDEELKKIEEARKTEEDYHFRKRRHRVLMGAGLVLTTAAMIAFIVCGQISYVLAMSFNAILAAVFGSEMK